MISRWDALPNLLVHGGYTDVPCHIQFRCERCGSTEFYRLEPSREQWHDPCDVTRTFCLRCTRCGMFEATIARTVLLGGQS